jgi:hypothetical protein
MPFRQMRSPQKSAATYRGVVALSGTADASALRSAQFDGKEYLVVPVVALVEGVLQGMNAPSPELALAAEFGKYPAGWNGRPVVMNHPVDKEGTPVSANDPTVLEDWSFGKIFNSTLDDKKLKVEAWIDVELAKSKGGEFQSTVDRINAGEMVEVSVGCFVSTYAAKGVYGGKAYKNVWTDVVPDHLALLSEGVLGACSNEAGCGAPRLNQSGESMATSKSEQKTIVTIKSESGKPIAIVREKPAANCGCGGKGPAANETAEDIVMAQQIDSAALASFTRRFATEALPDTLMNDDIRRILGKAVRKYDSNAYLLMFNNTHAIYESYSSTGYSCYQIPFTMSDTGEVSFSGDPEEINLITQVVKANQEKETSMTTKNASTEQPKVEDPSSTATEAAATEAAATASTEQSQPVAAAAAAKTEATKTPVTLAAFLETAPAEVRDVLNESVRVHSERKTTTIKALKDTGRCDFTDDQLKAMSLQQLESLNKLAAVPSYEGAAGNQPAVHSQSESGYIEAPRALVRKTA